MDGNFDDYDFTPSSSSNLASLFGISPVNPGNTSLTYSAPKQPRPTTLETSENGSKTTHKSSSITVVALVVLVWKLVNNKYESVGKLGLALIESSWNVDRNSCSHEIILYKDKQNVISRAKIFNGFNFTLNPDNFASFYDSVTQCWLIKFNSESDCLLICEKIRERGGKIVENEESTSKKSVDTADSKILSDDNILEPKHRRKKPDIIQRISKMGGQSILPNSYQSTDISDSDDDSFRMSTAHFRSSSPKKNVDEVIVTQGSHHHHDPLESTKIVQYPTHTGGFMMGQYDPMCVFLSENRSNNSEMRINLSQMSEKLNQVLRIVENSKERPNNEPSDDITTLKSRNKVLQLKIDNLMRDNQLNHQKYEKLQEKYNELSTRIDENNDGNKLKQLEKSFQDQQESHNTETSVFRENEIIFNDTITRQKQDLEEMTMKLQQSEDKQNDLLKEIEAMKSTIDEYQSKESTTVNDLTEKGKFVEYLKDAMSAMYGSIMENFSADQQYPSAEINCIVMKNIKATTRTIIQKIPPNV